MGRKLGAKEVTKERRNMILDMVDIGVRQIDIASYYGMPKSTVSNIVKRGRKVNEAETRGRSKKLTPRDTRSLLKVADKLRFKPLHKITSTYNQFAPVNVSINTVRRTLKANGIQNYTAASKPYLSSKNMKERITWANIHDNWNDDQWDRVVFSDESSFTVRPTSLKRHVWRKSNTKFELHNMVPTFKSGYVSLSVWGAFCSTARTPLVRINGTLKQEKYKDIIENYIVPLAKEQYGSTSSFVFQQDNCGPHKAKSVRTFLMQMISM